MPCVFFHPKKEALPVGSKVSSSWGLFPTCVEGSVKGTIALLSTTCTQLHLTGGKPTVVASLHRYCCCSCGGGRKQLEWPPAWGLFEQNHLSDSVTGSLCDPGSSLGPWVLLRYRRISRWCDVSWEALPTEKLLWGQVISSPRKGLFFLFYRKSARKYLGRKFCFHEIRGTNFWRFGAC